MKHHDWDTRKLARRCPVLAKRLRAAVDALDELMDLMPVPDTASDMRPVQREYLSTLAAYVDRQGEHCQDKLGRGS